ncbi:nodulation factor fucose acetyltransferase NolL [Mesorhizobium sangaii]|uniref:Fucose 4-O-acetylase-like acetyltransferase n=1 Tax=Mesorhizobium sangaii TaxID=505389 RepID=A0A841PFB8_9HYPH|nr:nodulation factor fucose acetyltransferase NolL [Mesorhizobium sangaii]MBB6414014.1 fucose 4-O-acetylase-like acetyltransferase [Mesorhizobium sangaii]
MRDQATAGYDKRDLRFAGANTRDLSFDFAKGVLIILVIIGHLLQSVIYRDTDSFWLSPYFMAIYMFHMPLFMAVSGYLSSGAILRKSFGQAVGDRAMQLLLPMVVWCALICALKSTFVSPPRSLSDELWDFSREFTGTYWFIWAAFASFLLIKFLITFSRLSMWIISASAVVVAFLPITLSIVPLARYTYAFFCLGFLFSSRPQLTSVIVRPELPLVVLLSTATCLCFLAWGRETYAYNNLVLVHNAQSARQVLLMFAGSAAASAVAMQFMFQCWRAGCSAKVVRFVAVGLGQSTLLLYLVQGAVFRLMDLIQFGQLWGLITRIVVASVLGVAIVVIAMTIRWMVRDLGYVSRLVGAPPRPGLLKKANS